MRRKLAALALCTLVAPAVAFILLWWPLRANGLGTSADFISFYGAGRMVREGQRQEVYDYEHQLSIQKQFTTHSDVLPFIHPPFEVWIFALLALFPFSTAFSIWTFCNLSILGLVFFLLHPHSGSLGTRERLFLLAASFYPALTTILQGQDSFIVLLAYVLAYINLKERRDFMAGCALALGRVKFQVVVPFAIIFLLAKRVRFVSGFLSAGALLTLISLFLSGFTGLWRYARFLLQMNAPGHETAHIYAAAMPNWRGVTYLFLAGRVPTPLLTAIVLSASALLIVWTSLKLRKAVQLTERGFDLQFALLVSVALMTSYYIFLHDLSPIILVAFLALNRLGWERDKLLLALPLVLLYIIGLIISSFGLREFSLEAVPVSCVIMITAWQLRRDRGGTEEKMGHLGV